MEECNEKDLKARSKCEVFQEEGSENTTKKETAGANSVRTLIEPNSQKLNINEDREPLFTFEVHGYFGCTYSLEVTFNIRFTIYQSSF